MSNQRRKCRLSYSKHRNVDLREYEQLIIDTVNKTVPGKNPKVFPNYFSTDTLTQSEAVSLGRALAKLEELCAFGKTITTFRLFDGKTYDMILLNLYTRIFVVLICAKKSLEKSCS